MVPCVVAGAVVAGAVVVGAVVVGAVVVGAVVAGVVVVGAVIAGVVVAGAVGGVVVVPCVVAGVSCAGRVCVVLAPAGPCVPPDPPASAKPTAVPPAASRNARVSTTGSRAVRRRDDRSPTGGAVSGGGTVGCGGGTAEPGADGCQVWARMVWVGLPYPTDAPAADRAAVDCVSWLSNCGAVGRSPGSLARAASTSGRSPSGTAVMSGTACTIRYKMTSDVPVPNGGCPLAA